MGEIYNVGSGRSLSIGEVIGQLIEISGMDIAAETHASRLRKNDVACVRADISKITTETGFTPSISIRRSLEDMWQDLKGRDNEG
jgi:GDP-4-dehydro-6-deoxy-D-mannose reductase